MRDISTLLAGVLRERFLVNSINEVLRIPRTMN